MRSMTTSVRFQEFNNAMIDKVALRNNRHDNSKNGKKYDDVSDMKRGAALVTKGIPKNTPITQHKNLSKVQQQ